ncbi:anthrax toxin lethal factor-related metalloendopeptidase [Enterococcus faecalis]|uniref:anthrax toxin lethal factor-related metalloendopeptidase n=1 Tax=Enterococcus faecalis TaxID=1351 RepID=UPI0035EBFED6
MKKKNSLILLWLLSMSLLPIVVNAESNDMMATQYNGDVDHKTDIAGAKKWAEVKYKNWEKKLSENKKAVIKKVIREKQSDVQKEQVTHHLQYLGGDLNNFHVIAGSEQEKLKKIYKSDIDYMNRIFNIKEGNTQENMYVYKNVSPSFMFNLEFGKPDLGFDQKILKSYTTIDRESFMQLKTDLDYGGYSSYLVTNIAEEIGGNDRIKLRIFIPKGTPSAYDGNNRIIFDKNSRMEFKDLTIITQNGKEYIRINASLVDKSNFENKIAKEKEKVNHEFNLRTGIFGTRESIDFIFDGMASSISINEIYKELKIALDLMHPKLVRDIFHFTHTENGGKVIFTDLPIWALCSTLKIPIENNDDFLSGWYDKKSTNIYIRMPFSLNKHTLNPDADPAHNTIIHEIGHAFDTYYGNIAGNTNGWISNSSTFKNIYDKEFDKLTDYGKESSLEFFAEAFRLYHVSPDDLKKAPETYEYINKLIKDIIK